MRALPVLLMLALAPACRSEPSFDERYEAQSKQISGVAANMQDALDEQINASVAAGRLGSPANGAASAIVEASIP